MGVGCMLTAQSLLATALQRVGGEFVFFFDFAALLCCGYSFTPSLHATLSHFFHPLIVLPCPGSYFSKPFFVFLHILHAPQLLAHHPRHPNSVRRHFPHSLHRCVVDAVTLTVAVIFRTLRFPFPDLILPTFISLSSLTIFTSAADSPGYIPP
ncbi:hypothetical protein C8R44DRAFT_768484 [Mycena epipterygia]|nr:hypothetical protein C8R44DRAFT_768484 [Mycena epipterygia]